MSGLPISILALFRPRDPLPFKPPLAKPHVRPLQPLLPFLDSFEDPNSAAPPMSWKEPESRFQRRDRKRREKTGAHSILQLEQTKKYDASQDPSIRGEPRRTIIVARLNYKSTEADLGRLFDRYGPIKRLRLVRDKRTDKSRGYAFIEYEKSHDANAAKDYMNGSTIDGKRVIVDLEKARTSKDWKPKRLGGGLGNRRPPMEKKKKKQKQEERRQHDRQQKDRQQQDQDRHRQQDQQHRQQDQHRFQQQDRQRQFQDQQQEERPRNFFGRREEQPYQRREQHNYRGDQQNNYRGDQQQNNYRGDQQNNYRGDQQTGNNRTSFNQPPLQRGGRDGFGEHRNDRSFGSGEKRPYMGGDSDRGGDDKRRRRAY